MLPGDIPQGHTHLGVGGIPDCWICCLATYLRGTLIWVVWGAFLVVGYAARQHTSGAHSFGWCGGHSTRLLDMLPGNIPQGHNHWVVMGGIPGCWVCCLATYPLLGGVGDIPDCWICCLATCLRAHSFGRFGGAFLAWICCLVTFLRGTLIWLVWGPFLAAGYAACKHTSGAHSFGWCGGAFLTAG
jgi:hypothetical protein